ncbi:carboxylating nicotinate-nucleotide diphosphorylase [Vampirovibrio chlorellavorus]|uniref:carboxylating nicotinate-nucleotide diphosphorylase n=1 Tax=Vampirovibrio chlorellavorus TaxID=758823 RepID=UPI0026ED109C|nr:carboxylating nicotinate-nucleotide diphosphorylase [Vampirovibrio chlorellavorus]
MTHTPVGAESLAIQGIVHNALLEDLAQGDVTTDSLPQLARLQKQALFRVRQDCVVSGLTVAGLVCQMVDSALVFTPMLQDGAVAHAGTVIAQVQGPMASILKAERTALNFLQLLSGVATETRRFVEAVSGTNTRITHTRKTTPGLRLLEQQAVLHGGGVPHRFNLGSCVMLKDNHLQALGDISPNEAIAVAVKTLRAKISHTTKIEVEADTLGQVQQAVEAGADIILLDNMSPDTIREALSLIQNRAIVEASGGISLETIRAYAETGVDVISTSKITLGVPAIDVGLDLA